MKCVLKSKTNNNKSTVQKYLLISLSANVVSKHDLMRYLADLNPALCHGSVGSVFR